MKRWKLGKPDTSRPKRNGQGNTQRTGQYMTGTTLGPPLHAHGARWARRNLCLALAKLCKRPLIKARGIEVQGDHARTRRPGVAPV
jgi:hypothetical protein